MVDVGLPIGEDRLTVIKLYYFANKIVFLPEAYYHYTTDNPSSLTNNSRKFSFSLYVKFITLIEEFMRYNSCSVFDYDILGLKVDNKLVWIRDNTGLRQRECISYFPEADMAWNKLVRREFILSNNLLFKDGILHEDELWSFMLMLKSRKVMMLGDVTYNYFVREGSIMTSPEKALYKVESMITILKDMVAYCSAEQSRERVKYLDRFAFKCYQENEKLKSGSYRRYRVIRHIHKGVKYIGSTREHLLTIHRHLPSLVGYLCCWVVSKLYGLR